MQERAIEITGTPEGEAPLDVREKWVGLVLPVVSKKRRIRIQGVLSAERNPLRAFVKMVLGKTTRETGYVVRILDAIAILEEHHPSAARWWRENTPHLVRPGKYFVFNQECCVEVSGTRPKDW